MARISKEQRRRMRQERTKQKADYLFMIYRLMGADRSLKKLAELCGIVGVKISEKRLEEYSSKYDWQRRILELNAVEVQRKEKSLVTQVEQMNQRHAEFAQALLAIAASGVRFMQQAMKDSPVGKTLPMTVHEIVDLFKAAQSGERLARGQATNRLQIWVDIASTVVQEFSLIFLAVNDIADPVERKAEFIRLADDMMRRYYSEASKQLVQMRTSPQRGE